MANRFKTDRPVRVELALPTSVYEPLALVLFSPALGKIPKGAWSEFFTTLARQALERMDHAESVHPATPSTGTPGGLSTSPTTGE